MNPHFATIFFALEETDPLTAMCFNTSLVSADSDFNKYAFVIFSAAVHESIQAWVGERYQTDLDTDDTLKRRNTITVLFSTEGFAVGHYTAMIPTSEDVMARPTLDEISFYAERLGIRVNVNNYFSSWEGGEGQNGEA